LPHIHWPLVAELVTICGDVWIGVGFGGQALTKQPATDQRTYGRRLSSILAALANAIFRLVAVMRYQLGGAFVASVTKCGPGVPFTWVYCVSGNR